MASRPAIGKGLFLVSKTNNNEVAEGAITLGSFGRIFHFWVAPNLLIVPSGTKNYCFSVSVTQTPK